MTALPDLIKFLLELIRDPAARAAFEKDPEGELADRGLEGVSAHDVRDARLLAGDDGGAYVTGDEQPPGGDDPIREIAYTARNYTADPASAPPASAPALGDQTFITNNFLSDDDVTIVNDSFNSDVEATQTVIRAENSFNTDIDAEQTAIRSDGGDIVFDDAPVSDLRTTEVDGPNATEVNPEPAGGVPEVDTAADPAVSALAETEPVELGPELVDLDTDPIEDAAVLG